MNTKFSKLDYIASLLSAAFGGLVVYIILAYLHVLGSIIAPISIAIAILIFGLTRYYSAEYDIPETRSESHILRDRQNQNIDRSKENINSTGLSVMVFASVFIALLIISYTSNSQDIRIFDSWSNFGAIKIIQLVSAIVLCFFIPGYGIVLILKKKYSIGAILSVVLAYLFSILVTGLTSYVSSLSFDAAISQSAYLFTFVYLSILICVITRYRTNIVTVCSNVPIKKNSFFRAGSKTILKLGKYSQNRSSELLVFGSLLSILIISTYVVYGGITIGDQWYHQGRALLFMSGDIRESVISGAESTYYPPFQSALLAALPTLSGIPLVNGYASIAILNAVPMFAFYYFFTTWVPSTVKKASLIACSLFLLSAGFGWIYMLDATVSDKITSAESALKAIGSIADLDIISATNFVIPTAPDFSTALIYIALPAGFVLLALVRTTVDHRLSSIFILSAVSFLGILSHYEFYIFVIIASILPAIFKLKAKSYVYASLLIAISAVYLLDVATPANYYIYLDIVGIPLIVLAALFVTITWTIYLCTPYLQKISQSKWTFKNFAKTNRVDRRFKLVTVTIIVFLVVYAYVLSFVVIGQVTLGAIREHTNETSVPWYLYPMRMGVAGLLGLAFVLSYLFRKFEKQVFVFGIIIIVSLIMGPYYDEARFSKYMMIGIIGFASLMIFKLLSWRTRYSVILNAAIIGIVVVSSGLSILIFVGYNSLIFQTGDFTAILSRRHFPTDSELKLLQVINNVTDTNTTRYNIVSTLNEYDRKDDGIMSKISSFAGLPYDKLRQTPLALNASSIDRLFSHLEYGDVKYILLPTKYINTEEGINPPIRFALDNFKQIYQNKNYILLEAPPVRGPSFFGKNLAIVHGPSVDSISSNSGNTSILEFNNKTFNFKKDNAIRIDNETGQAVLVSMKNSTSLSSKIIDSDKRINSMEVEFRVLSIEKQSVDNSYVIIRWSEGENQYSAKLSKSGLGIYQKLKSDQHFNLLFNSTELSMRESLRYNVNVQDLENKIRLLVNGINIEIPKHRIENQTIARVGFTSFLNNVEFKPVKISNEPEFSNVNSKNKYYDYNYPLSILALSNSNYDIYKYDDFSVFANDIIIVPDQLKLNEDTYNRYLEYARSGGTLVVINSNGNFSGTFSKIFNVKSNYSTPETFTGISSNSTQNLPLKISGVVNRFDIKSVQNLTANTWYRNSSNQAVAPFSLDKTISNGKIILVNAKGYFDAVSNSSKQHFSSLSKISSILGLWRPDAISSENTSMPMKGIIGFIQASGKSTLNSTSMLLGNKDGSHYPLNVSKITISDKEPNVPIVINDALIRDIILSGGYQVMVNNTDIQKLPDMESDNNYLGFYLPGHFNMTVQLYPQKRGSILFNYQTENDNNTILASNNSKIEFYDVKLVTPAKFEQMLLKNPEVTVDGHINIKNTYFDGYLAGSGALIDGTKLDLQGKFKTRFDFTDSYYESYKNGIRSKFISYLNFVEMSGNTGEKQDALRIPGDIPNQAIKEGKDLPLITILKTSTNVFILIVLIIVTICIMYFFRYATSPISRSN